VEQSLHRAQKVRIAAARLIGDGDTIILDSGSTTAEIAKQLRSMPLRSVNVITSALNVALLLADTCARPTSRPSPTRRRWCARSSASGALTDSRSTASI